MSRKGGKTRRNLILFHFFLFLLWLVPTFADIYYYVDKNGVWHFTNIKTSQRYRLYLKSLHKRADKYIKDYDAIIKRAAKRFSVDPALVKAIIKAESNFDERAISCDGAAGLMQLMPDTAKDIGVSDPMDPEENIMGGVKYLSELLREFKDLYLAIAAYNAGPSAVRYYKGVPPFSETRRFLKMVLRYYKRYKGLRHFR
jgi:soluble lytic murein transglycosylase